MKMEKKLLTDRRGNLFLLVLVTIAVGGGLASTKVVPNMGTALQKTSEMHLQATLAEIRSAIALERLAKADNAKFFANWNDRTNLQNYLIRLVELKFLPQLGSDPTSLRENWGIENKYYWVPTRNYVSSSGFEIQQLADTSWATGSTNILATLTQDPQWIWIGDSLGPVGHSLLIQKP